MQLVPSAEKSSAVYFYVYDVTTQVVNRQQKKSCRVP